MPSIGEALGALEQALFVGRARELAYFRSWLTSTPGTPKVLNISGPGGVGKSTLLRVFARQAEEMGRPTVLVDGQHIASTPEDLLAALGGSSLAEVHTRLNDMRPLLLLDTFEELLELSRFIRTELLAGLDASAKIVIAGRYSLKVTWSSDPAWVKVLWAMPLAAFSMAECRAYLQRRGLGEPASTARIVAAAGGNPLALSLAADMVQQLELRDLHAQPEWRLVVHSLVEQLLRDVRDPVWRELLEVCSVVRQFDEATLAAISGREWIGEAFEQLCRLSAVRATEHGLMLHEDVRRALADDLRWRAPERYSTLRLRALAHWQGRMRSASQQERSWLLAERLFLLSNTVVQEHLFGATDSDPVWLEPGRAEDHPELHRIWATTLEGYPAEIDFSGVDQRSALDAVLDYAGTRLRVVRDSASAIVGFSTCIPVSRSSLPVLEAHRVHGPLVRAYIVAEERQWLPDRDKDSVIWCLDRVAHTHDLLEPVRAALLRDLCGLFALGGVYLCPLVHPMGKALMESLGFVQVPEARVWNHGPVHALDGYVLDLRRIGIERWLGALMAGRRPPRVLRRDELERELQAALLYWHDDRRLVDSPLISSTVMGSVEAEGPPALRRALREALERARTSCTPEARLAYDAVELAYLEGRMSYQGAAQRLAVSRATFYRLLKRGVSGLADVMAQPSPTP